MQVTKVVLDPGTPKLLAFRMEARQYLGVINVGMGHANIGFSPGLAMGDGWPLDGAYAAGRQGGSLIIGRGESALVRTDVFAVSADGTTLMVMEG